MIPWVSLKRKKSAGTFEYLRRFIQSGDFRKAIKPC